MFILTVIEDKIKTQPEQFDRDTTEVLIEQIELKYCNRILVDVGLCIAFYDFLEVGDPFIYPAEGASHQHIKFRLVVFRPFVGEIMVGKIRSSDKAGLIVSVEFFADILIPPCFFNENTAFNPSTSLWTWQYGEGEEQQDFVMELGDEIRFRVKSLSFTAVTSTAKGLQKIATTEMHRDLNETRTLKAASAGGDRHGGAAVSETPGLQGATLRRRSSSISQEDDHAEPMRIVGSISGDGLGLTSWWS